MTATARTTTDHAVGNHHHIAVVTETYVPEVNGVAFTLGRFVHGLRGRGHAVSIVRPRQHSEDSLRRLNDSHVTLVRGLPLPGYQGLQFGLPTGKVLQRSWTDHPPDVVYVATEGPLGWSAVATAQRFGIPVLSGFHTNFHSYSRHYHAGFLHPVILRYLRAFHNRTNGTLVPSHDLRDRLDRLGFHNVSVLGRGVDTTLFNPTRRSEEVRQRWGVTAQDVVVLYVGRVAPEKNLHVAVAAYRAMQQQDQRVKFVVVGDGPLRTSLQHDHSDIIFPGLLTGEQLAQQYASADVFLFPSETETFGNVTLEALASGLAVIAYNYAAAKMHIVHRDTGVLVPFGERQQFINAATELIRAPQLISHMREQARTYATSVSWGRAIERFEMLLLNALSRSLRVAQPSVRYGELTA